MKYKTSEEINKFTNISCQHLTDFFRKIFIRQAYDNDCKSVIDKDFTITENDLANYSMILSIVFCLIYIHFYFQPSAELFIPFLIFNAVNGLFMSFVYRAVLKRFNNAYVFYLKFKEDNEDLFVVVSGVLVEYSIGKASLKNIIIHFDKIYYHLLRVYPQNSKILDFMKVLRMNSLGIQGGAIIYIIIFMVLKITNATILLYCSIKYFNYFNGSLGYMDGLLFCYVVFSLGMSVKNLVLFSSSLKHICVFYFYLTNNLRVAYKHFQENN